MTLTQIAIQGLRRRKGKAAFVLAGLAVGVATVVAVIGFSRATTHSINHRIEKYGANIIILPASEHLPLSYGGLSLGSVSVDPKEIRQDALAAVRTIKNAGNIAALGPMVLGVATADDRRLLLAGIDFDAARILKPWWTTASGKRPAAGEALVGSAAAAVLGLAAGDTLALSGHRLRVSGVLGETGSQDDHLVFTDLDTAQRLLDKPGRLSLVEVAALCKDCPIEEMVEQIAAAMPAAQVMAIQQVVKGRMAALAQLNAFAYGVSAVVVIVGALVVLVTMMGAVRERTGEIGILRAIGFRRRHILQIVFTEAACLSAISGVAGYALGAVGAAAACRFFFGDPAVAHLWDPVLATAAVGTAMVTGLGASAYPARMASRMDPNEALRRR